MSTTTSTAENLPPWVAKGSFHNGTHYILREPTTTPAKGIVVFVHGIGSYHTCFNKLALLLVENGFRTLQYDLIGRGFSDASKNSRYGGDEHDDQLIDLLDHVFGRDSGLRYHVIAHSMGGSLATIFTSRHPELVKSLTLLSPAGMMGYFPIGFVRSVGCLRGVLRGMFSELPRQETIWRQEYIAGREDTIALREECVDDLRAMYLNTKEKWMDAMVGCVLEFPMTDISSDISRVASTPDLPVHLMWGRKDAAVPYNNKPRWTKLMRNGACKLSCKSYDKAGHVFFDDFHVEVQPDILQFLEANV